MFKILGEVGTADADVFVETSLAKRVQIVYETKSGGGLVDDRAHDSMLCERS